MKKGMRLRRFRTNRIPDEVVELLQTRLEESESVEDIVDVFDEYFGTLEELTDE
jgi:hypothetical protein